MCGLVGGTGLITNKEYEAIHTLFLNNVLRGVDSCGVFYTYKDGAKEWYDFHKSLDASSEFVVKEDWAKILNKKPICIAAHSRAATKGSVTLANAHPFEVPGKMLGMHNGTIHGKFEGSSKFDTDSEALVNLIAKKGLKKALSSAYNDAATMAYTLVLYNIEGNEVNIIRNYARPMFIARHKTNFSKMFWASEKIMLAYALSKCGLLNDYEVEELKIHALLSFDPFRSYSATDKEDGGVKIEEDWFKIPTRNYVVKHNDGWWNNNNTYEPNKHNNKGRSVTTYHGYDGMPDKDITYEVGQKVKDLWEESKIKSLEKAGVPTCFKIGEKYESLVEFLHTIENGCQVCGNPSTIVNNNWKKFKFESGKTKDFICDTCTDKHNDDLLACEFGLVNLVSPKAA